MEIWLRRDGEEYGPYTLEQVKEFVASGESVLEDEAWFDGCEDYVAVGDIPHFTSPRKVALEEHGKKKSPLLPCPPLLKSPLLPRPPPPPDQTEVPTPEEEEKNPWNSRYFVISTIAGIISVVIPMVNLVLFCGWIFCEALSASPAGGTGAPVPSPLPAIFVLAFVGLIFGGIGVGQARVWFWKGVIVLGGLFNGLPILFLLLSFCERIRAEERAADELKIRADERADERAAAQLKLIAKAPTEPVLTAVPAEGKSFSIPDINLDMLWCNPGTFMMGSPMGEKGRDEDETQHEVTLTQGFWLGKYEVTQQREKVMGKNPSHFKGAALPVEQVTWEDAMGFCEKLTQMEKAAGRLPEGYHYNLPTEAQWEYACRAGTTTAYSFGGTITPRQANYERNVGTTPVGTYPANTWGFHDLHGNVYEWCLDRYGDYPSGQVTDPVGPSNGSIRVYRGGGWYDLGRNLRSAARFRRTPGNRLITLGFRLSLQTAKTE